jgi:cell division septal protein FtsQ
LDKAIKHASTNERRIFLEKHKNEFIKNQKRKLRQRGFATFGMIVLLAGVIIGGAVVVWMFLQGYFNG